MSIAGALVFGNAGLCEDPIQLAHRDNGGLIAIVSAWSSRLLICLRYLYRSPTSARGALARLPLFVVFKARCQTSAHLGASQDAAASNPANP